MVGTLIPTKLTIKTYIMRRDYILKRLEQDGYAIETLGKDYVISRNGDTFFGKLNKVFYEIYGYVDKTNMINTK